MFAPPLTLQPGSTARDTGYATVRVNSITTDIDLTPLLNYNWIMVWNMPLLFCFKTIENNRINHV